METPRFSQRKRLAVVVSVFFVLVLVCLGTYFFFREAPLIPAVASVETEMTVPPAPTTTLQKIVRVPLPAEVRGIYWTADTAGSKRGDTLLAYMLAQKLNTVVIDVGMDDGELAFDPLDKTLLPYRQDAPAIKDLEGLLERLAQNHIYRIARIPVMKNSVFAHARPSIALKTSKGNPWRDGIGAMWVDPAAPETAAYALAVAREAYGRGFDEVQFDYVRFPSDGSISSIVYPVFDMRKETKIEAMQQFFQDVAVPLKAEGVPISFDLFGITFWLAHDYNIGQRLVDAFPVSDFVSPMVYPSHYPIGFKGHNNPALYPYEIVKTTLDEGATQLLREMNVSSTDARAKFRPWLQDFDMGAIYDEPRVAAQVKAARDAGASGWILWNARNVYEPTLHLE